MNESNESENEFKSFTPYIRNNEQFSIDVKYHKRLILISFFFFVVFFFLSVYIPISCFIILCCLCAFKKWISVNSFDVETHTHTRTVSTAHSSSILIRNVWSGTVNSNYQSFSFVCACQFKFFGQQFLRFRCILSLKFEFCVGFVAGKLFIQTKFNERLSTNKCESRRYEAKKKHQQFKTGGGCLWIGKTPTKKERWKMEIKYAQYSFKFTWRCIQNSYISIFSAFMNKKAGALCDVVHIVFERETEKSTRTIIMMMMIEQWNRYWMRHQIYDMDLNNIKMKTRLLYVRSFSSCLHFHPNYTSYI